MLLSSADQIEKEYKEKWLRKFQEEIREKRIKEIEERNKNLKQENDYLENLKIKEEEIKRRNDQHKLNQINYKMENHYNYIQRKRIEEEEKQKIKEEKNFPFLDLKSEERLITHKNHIVELEDKVDRNYEITKNFIENLPKNQKFSVSKSYGDSNIFHRRDYSDYESNKKINFNINKNNETKISTSLTKSNPKNYDSNYLNDYFSFQNYTKQCGDYNHRIIEDKAKKHTEIFKEKKELNDKRSSEMENFLASEFIYKKQQLDKQIYYRNLLDSQLQLKSNMVQRAQSLPHLVSLNKETYNDKEIPVNPYSQKTYDTGMSKLPHNPILYPIHNFQYNKYLLNK